jgi:hypothetical protein
MGPDPELAEASGTPQVKQTLPFFGQNSDVIASTLGAHSAASNELVDHFIVLFFNVNKDESNYQTSL